MSKTRQVELSVLIEASLAPFVLVKEYGNCQVSSYQALFLVVKYHHTSWYTKPLPTFETSLRINNFIYILINPVFRNSVFVY